MNIFADRYQFRARIIPEFLTVLPLAIVLVSFAGELLVFGLLSFALFFIFFQGHFSSKLGRNLQNKLYKQNKLEWHDNYLFKLYQEDKHHKYIVLLKQAVQKSGKKNPFTMKDTSKRTDQIDQIMTWIREQTRDIEKFSTVFDKNCDYGYFRNMLALRPWALGSLVLAIVVLSLSHLSLPLVLTLDISLIKSQFEYWLSAGSFWFLFGLLWVVFWLKVSSVDALNKASRNYIEALLQSVEGIEAK